MYDYLSFSFLYLHNGQPDSVFRKHTWCPGRPFHKAKLPGIQAFLHSRPDGLVLRTAPVQINMINDPGGGEVFVDNREAGASHRSFYTGRPADKMDKSGLSCPHFPFYRHYPLVSKIIHQCCSGFRHFRQTANQFHGANINLCKNSYK